MSAADAAGAAGTMDAADAERGLGAVAASWLVAKREIRERLRSKAFLISTGILLLLAIGGAVGGSIAAKNQAPPIITIVGDPVVGGHEVRDIPGLSVRPSDGLADAERLVRSGEVDAAVVGAAPPGSADGTPETVVQIIAKSEVPGAVVDALSVSPSVKLLEPAKTDGALRYFVAVGFGLVFFASAMTFGSMIAQSVVEEKSTRVVELLLAAVPARSLLAGKVLGNTLLALAQIAAFVAIGAIALHSNGADQIVSMLAEPLGWFAGFYVIGFVLLAAMFAATGALVSRQEDVGSTSMPVTMLTMLPYFLVIFFNDNPTVVTIMSYVPFSAPVGMPLRVFLGQAQWWEPLVSLVVIAASTAAVLALGSRIYSRSLLKLGARVAWRDALKA